MRNFGSLSIAAMLMSLGGLSTPAVGATGEIEEIVVTARQRAESLQDTPVTITAVSSETIERLALNNLDQISDLVPNLTISYGSSGASSTVTLRGIGTGSASAGFSSAVGLLIDDLHFERGRWVQGGMVDLAQVEVLKGPQALYFGKNNTSGLIILQTRDPVPGQELEANFRAGYETDANEYLLEAGVSLSLSDTFAVRFAGRHTDQEGWIKNNAIAQPGTADPNLGYAIPGSAGTRDLPGLEDTMGRFTAIWTPNDQFKLKFKSSITSTEDGGLIYHDQLSRCFGPGGRPLDVFGVPSPADDCKANYTRAKSNIPAALIASEPSEFGDGTTFTEYDAYRFSVRMDYELEQLTLTSVTGFAHYDSDATENATFAGDAQVPFFERTDHDSISQEFRIQTQFDSPVNFLGGILYSEKDLYFRNSARIAPFGPDSRNGRQWTWDKIARQDSSAWSAYGELVWDVSDTVEISGGARYTDEERDFRFDVPFLHEVFDVFLPGILSSQSLDGVFKDDNVSPQVTVSWSPQDNITVFGAYREGFKSGGFDASHTLAPGDPADVINNIRFESEKADGFEFGIKSRWFDDTLQINATAYFFDYSDLQLSTLDTETTQFRIQNVAAASTDGVEVDLTWAATDNLTVRGFANFNEAKYDEFLTSCFAGQTIEQGCDQALSAATGRFGAQRIDGDQVPGAPEWFASLGFTYDIPLGSSAWRASLDLDARYVGERSGSLQRMPDSDLDSYTILDTSVRLYSADDHWEFTLIGRNLTDELVLLSYTDRPLTGGGNGLPAGSPGIQRADSVSRVLRGQQFWLQASYRF